MIKKLCSQIYFITIMTSMLLLMGLLCVQAETTVTSLSAVKAPPSNVSYVYGGVAYYKGYLYIQTRCPTKVTDTNGNLVTYYDQSGVGIITLTDDPKNATMNIPSSMFVKNWGGTTWNMDGPGLIYVNDHYLYTTTAEKGIKKFDLEPDPSNPVLVATFTGTTTPKDMKVVGNYLFVADVGYRVYNDTIVGTKENPVDVSPILNKNDFSGTTIGNTVSCDIEGNYFYLMANNKKIYAFDISNFLSIGSSDFTPASYRLIDNSDSCWGMRVKNGYAYIAGRNTGKVHILDLNDSYSLATANVYSYIVSRKEANPTSVAYQPWYLSVDGDYLYIISQTTGITPAVPNMEIVYIGDPTNPVRVVLGADKNDFLLKDNAYQPIKVGDYLFIANYSNVESLKLVQYDARFLTKDNSTFKTNLITLNGTEVGGSQADITIKTVAGDVVVPATNLNITDGKWSFSTSSIENGTYMATIVLKDSGGAVRDTRSITFTKDYKPVVVHLPIISTATGFSAQVLIDNPSSDSRKANISAVLLKDGHYILSKSYKVSLSPNSSSVNATVSLTSSDIAKGDIIRVFVWDDITFPTAISGMRPLTDIYQYDISGSPLPIIATEMSTLQSFLVDVQDDVIVLNGNIQKNAEQDISVVVLKSGYTSGNIDNYVLYVNQYKTAADGSFKLDIMFDDINSATSIVTGDSFKILVNSPILTQPLQAQFHYSNYTTRTQLLNDIKNSSNTSILETRLSNLINEKDLKIEYTNTINNFIYSDSKVSLLQYMYDNRMSFNSILDIRNAFVRKVALLQEAEERKPLDSVKNATIADIYSIMNTYKGARELNLYADILARLTLDNTQVLESLIHDQNSYNTKEDIRNKFYKVMTIYDFKNTSPTASDSENILKMYAKVVGYNVENNSVYTGLVNKAFFLDFMFGKTYADLQAVKDAFDINLMVSAFNNASITDSTTNMEIYIKKADYLQLTKISLDIYNSLSNTARSMTHSMLVKKGKLSPYISAQDIKARFNLYVAISAINNSQWTEMERVLAANDFILGLANKYGDWKALQNENEKHILFMALQGKNFDDQNTIEIAYSTAMNAIKNERKQIEARDKQKSDSGNSGSRSVVVSGIITPQLPVEPTEQSSEPIFKDLDNVSWAREAILKMAKKEIVKGYEDGTFGPERDVTRAEFAKMLVLTFGLVENIAGSKGFTDVKADEWYYKYITIAVENGIIKGMPDGSFSPDMPMTRQDMAVMITRAIVVTKQNMSSSDISIDFDDKDDISDYAKESVALLVSNKILNGVDNMKIMPLSVANRAMVSQVLSYFVK